MVPWCRGTVMLSFECAKRPAQNLGSRARRANAAQHSVLAIMPPIVHCAWFLVKKMALMTQVTQTCRQNMHQLL